MKILGSSPDSGYFQPCVCNKLAEFGFLVTEDNWVIGPACLLFLPHILCGTLPVLLTGGCS